MGKTVFVLLGFLIGCSTATPKLGRSREPAQVPSGPIRDSYKDCLALGAEVAKLGGKLTSKIPRKWSQSEMTDPKAHDPKNYAYIVHAIGSNLLELKNPDIGTFFPYIWVSLISSDAPYTYMRGSGIILAMEPDNLVANSCYDTAFQMPVGEGEEQPNPGQLAEGLAKYRALHRELTPEQMLRATIWPHVMSGENVRKYGSNSLDSALYLDNELILKGRGDAGTVLRTIGVFINLLDPYPDATVNALREFAAKYSLPIVEVVP